MSSVGSPALSAQKTNVWRMLWLNQLKRESRGGRTGSVLDPTQKNFGNWSWITDST
jgi:hypothetical protein